MRDELQIKNELFKYTIFCVFLFKKEEEKKNKRKALVYSQNSIKIIIYDSMSLIFPFFLNLDYQLISSEKSTLFRIDKSLCYGVMAEFFYFTNLDIEFRRFPFEKAKLFI